MSGWYYEKSGLLNNLMIGPFSDQALLQKAFDGELKATTMVQHAAHTRGQWVALEVIPAAKKKLAEGEQHRRLSEQQRNADKERQAKAAIAEAAERKANSPIARFLLDGQPEAAVEKIFTRVSELLTSNEHIEYIAVQAKPLVIAPDCVAVTNRRCIVFRQKMLGQMDFDDYQWMYLFNAQLKEGVMYADLTFQVTNGTVVTIGYLPKAQARKIYRIAQEREEQAIETRRSRQIEEQKASATNIVVNAPVAATAPVVTADDPVEKLTRLKQMLDRGLITASEYDETKRRILTAM